MQKNIPTEEQRTIIEALKNNKVIKINAFAGTGKTSTLQMLTDYYKSDSFLYLAYNKSIELEAKNKFGRNVEVKTIHALAYKYVMLATDLNLKKIVNYTPKLISDLFKIDYKKSKQILLVFNYYCNSDKLEPSILYQDYIKSIISKIENKELEISFDYILKKFQLLLNDGLTTNSFDTILLDEAQDSNDVILDIFKRLNSNNKVLVGDKHQQIYSFRDSKNVMTKIEGKELSLTKTFRFSKKIAFYANTLLNRFKGETLKILSDIDEISFDSAYKNLNNTIGFISRGNAYLISKMKELSNKNKKYKTVRHPKEIFLTIKDIAYFLDNNKKSISMQNRFLQSLNNKKDLEDYIMQTKDYQLETTLRVYNVLFDNDIKNLLRLEAEAIEYFRSDNIFRYYLTTAHTAKGLEFDLTYIADDFFPFEKLIYKMGYKTYQKFYDNILQDKNKLFDEFNLLYVAITRCKFSMKIDDNNFKYITSNSWKEILNENLSILNQQYGCRK